MTSTIPQTTVINIRPIQYRDLEDIARLAGEEVGAAESSNVVDLEQQLRQLRRWYGVLKCVSWFPNPLRSFFCAYVAEQNNQLRGLIQVSPFNRTRSTWRIDRVMVDRAANATPSEIGSQLLRHCFQAIWEARTWLVEVNVNDKATLALYRQNGFQTLAHITYWTISPEILQVLAQREPDLPNLLPVSNADACLLYQLDTQSMPSFVRQVYDRHIADFKTSLMKAIGSGVTRWFRKTDLANGYVFESQRKAAIGYFQLQLCRDGSQPHTAQLTVHPAYTWLYPELLTQMARVTQEVPAPLQLTSTDYQPEREEFLEQIGATRTEHTLMMSRSVWHKLRESKFSLEALQLAEVLQGLQPARKPVPGRFSFAENATPAQLDNRDSTTQSRSDADDTTR
ncbi:GNAT family N-acetyltransferase [Leptolyngbya sp. NK1-12]|uniref:GNAT family N-acetyltransferase n=1 Tax=Leptolyngbya sp. NK1-12 TaxID=2547451 RepID=A0AA97AJQ2_9CYAN|nr:GNAT family N-acetyltransferase [Leptolyngbya sp. NK1-12]WNZ25156.1 GNAT family N-acetyltransferase [Leptolyngbya sp. NK1-12]